MSDQPPQETLHRSLGFWALTIYGVGDILGAGIYGLVGQVAGEAGGLTWASFLVAMLVAGLTGLSYAELVSRRPQSAGEVAYANEAFGRPWLSFLVGWMVFCSGVVSLSTVTHACGNYVLGIWSEIPPWVIWLVYVGFVSGINFWGIRQSSLTNILFTAIEAAGLLFIIGIGLASIERNPLASETPQMGLEPFLGVMQGATFAFFAYIGFEDMVNVAEEVKAPERNYPKAIITAVSVCGCLYLMVSLACLAVMPAAELAKGDAPLLAVVRRAAPAVPPVLFTGVAVIAIANTGLLNSIMASRLLYGMANQRLLPAWLSAVHERTRTPHRAVLTLSAIALVLIFSGTLSQLASTTSLLLLIVFTIVNASLLRLKAKGEPAERRFSVPWGVPVLALISCLGLMLFVEPLAWIWGGVLIAIGGVLAAFAHRRPISVTDLDETPAADE